MGLFGKNKNYDFDDEHNNDLFTDDDDFTVTFSRKKAFNSSDPKVSAPHAITAEELLENKPENIAMTGSHSAPSVYELLKKTDSTEKSEAIDDDYVPSWAVAEKAPSPVEAVNEPTVPAEPLKTEAASPAAFETDNKNDDFLKRCLYAMGGSENDEGNSEADSKESRSEDYSIGAKYDLNAFYPEQQAKRPQNMAAAHSDIDADAIIRRLKGESEEPAQAEKPEPQVAVQVPDEPAVNEKDVTADAKEFAVDAGSVHDSVYQAETADKEPEEIKMEEHTAGADEPRKLNVSVEVIPPDAPEKIMSTTMSAASAAASAGAAVKDDVRVYGKIVKGAVIQSTPDGDVSGANFVKAPPATGETRVFDSALDDIMSSLPQNTARPNRSAELYEDDFDEDDGDDGYLYDDDGEELKTPYYESDDTSLDGVSDYKTLSDSARLRVKYSGEFRSHKTLATLSFVAAAAAAVLSAVLGRFTTGIAAGVSTFVLLAVAVFLNVDMFKSLGGLFSKHPDFGCCVSLAGVVSLISSAVCTFAAGGKYPAAPVAVMLLLACYRASRAVLSHRILRGLEVIGNSENKRALASVDGEASDEIASGAIDGEALTVVGKNTVNISSFVKNSLYKSPLDCRSGILFVIGAIIAVVSGGIALYLADIATALTVMSLALCCVYPSAMAISDELSLGRIAKKLLGYDAAIAGYKGAYELNLANVVAVSSSDLFPDGSVTLYSMKTLGNNEIGQTLADAAAVAIAAGSPLSGIFRSMLGGGVSDMPKVGGVKYEDKMGLSGWIGDNTVLIGNRNLMQAHNIPVPPVTVDQKILRAGYFPVYISCHGVPCILFIVKYETDPAVKAELQSLCSTGMTVSVYPEDPNTTDSMICDYFDLPNDAIKVMSHNARVSYEKAVEPTDSASASAVSKKNPAGLFSAVSSGLGLWRTLSAMTVLSVVAAVLGGVLVLYLAVTGKLWLAASLAFAAYQAVFALLALALSKPKR